MRQDLTDITLVIDRSGSMMSCCGEAENGVNFFIRAQREAPGQALLSLLQFDTALEWEHRSTPIGHVGEYKLIPRGATALFDAIGEAITETGNRLMAIPEDERPGLVIIAIVTDGQENSSHRYTKEHIREMTNHQQDVYKWQFTYLGANQDSFDVGTGLGVAAAAISNYDTQNSVQMYSSLSSNVSRMRSSLMVGDAVVNSYTSTERRDMEGA